MHTEPLKKLADHRGPFASVYLDYSHDTEDAAAQLELRRREIRGRLTEQGADEDLVNAVDTAISEHEPPAGRAGLAVLTARGASMARPLRQPPAQLLVRYSELPYLLPLARWAQHSLAHVVVVVDRVGADFRVVDRHGRLLTEEQLTGDEHPVHKVRGGGWSHRSMQSRVEETVKHNVQQIAAETERLATLVGARAVVVAGEVQARSAVLAELPPPAKEVAVEAQAGGRAAGSDADAMWREIDELLDGIVEADRRTLLDRYRAEQGQQRAVTGLSPTTAVLREGNTEVLLVDPQRVEPLTVWCAPDDPRYVGVSRDALRDLGVADAVQRRADEAIPMAAVAVGAQLEVGDELDLADGVGALLRYH